GATAGNIVTFTGGNPITFSNTLANYNVLQATLVYQTSTNSPVKFDETLAGAGGLTLMGGAGSSVTFTQVSTFTGAVTASGGTVTVAGANGALAGTTNLTLNQGGTITLDNTAANNTARVNPAATVTLNGGTFNLVGNSAAASSQTFTTALTLGGASL